MSLRLAIVTASTNLWQAASCLRSWKANAVTNPDLFLLLNGPRALEDRQTIEPALRTDLQWVGMTLVASQYLGTVQAFQQGTTLALEHSADIIACFHDDVHIGERGWDDQVLEHFRRHPRCGLAGFGGAIGLGDDDLYRKPYNPMSLARKGFRSNLDEAEKHGIRSTLPEKVACLDGFSQIGRRAFWRGERSGAKLGSLITDASPWQQILDQGIYHHFYDGCLGALAARAGWETWYLPIRCHHYGGRTAVADAGYRAWADAQIPGGDQGYWEQSHQHAYQWLQDVLPLRV